MFVPSQINYQDHLQLAHSVNALTEALAPDRRYFLGETLLEEGAFDELGETLFGLARESLVGDLLPLYAEEWLELLDERELVKLKEHLEVSAAVWISAADQVNPPRPKLMPGMYVKLKEELGLSGLRHPLKDTLNAELMGVSLRVREVISKLVTVTLPDDQEVIVPDHWLEWVPDEEVTDYGYAWQDPHVQVAYQLLEGVSSRRIKQLDGLKRLMVKPVSDGEVRTIMQRAGSWVSSYDVSEDRPSEFSGFFMICEETGHGIRGSIVKGNDWDYDDSPQWKLVHGATQDQRKWYADNGGMAYLGKQLDPRWLDISDHVCWSHAKYQQLAQVSLRDIKKRAKLGQRLANFDQVQAIAGDWVEGYTVSEEEPSEFTSGYFMFCGGSNWYVKGAIVTGQHWDHSSCPKWRLVHGKAKGDGEWFEGNSDMSYLGPNLTEALLNLSDQLCEEESDSELEEIDGRGKLPMMESEVAKPVVKSRELEVGDEVRVKPSVESPKFGWGSVSHDETGRISEVRDDMVKVDFPSQTSWSADPNELVLVSGDGMPETTVDQGSPLFVRGDIWGLLTREEGGEEWSRLTHLDEVREDYLRYKPQELNELSNTNEDDEFSERGIYPGMIIPVIRQDQEVSINLPDDPVVITEERITRFEQLSITEEKLKSTPSILDNELETLLDSKAARWVGQPLKVMDDLAMEMGYELDSSRGVWTSDNGPVELRLTCSSHASLRFKVKGNTSFGFGLLSEEMMNKGDLVKRGVGWVNASTSGDYLEKTPANWSGEWINLTVNMTKRQLAVSSETQKTPLVQSIPSDWHNRVRLAVATWNGCHVELDFEGSTHRLDERKLAFSEVAETLDLQSFYFNPFVKTSTLGGDQSEWEVYRGYLWQVDEPPLWRQLQGPDPGGIYPVALSDLQRVRNL